MIKFICHALCKAEGWKVVNKLPKELKQAVVIGYPHTSNWDFKIAMFLIKDQRLKARFAIKKEWLKFPFKIIFEYLGAIGINRSKDKSVSTTDVLATLFDQNEKLLLMISPEGTRSLKTKWKTGFYYIAQKANVPIVTLKADYVSKTISIGELILNTTDFDEDMIKISKCLKGTQGKNPKNSSIDLRFDK